MARRAATVALAGALSLMGAGAPAQDAGGFALGRAADERPGVLVIDRETVLRRSRVGQTRLAAIAEDEAALAAENREIEARLTAEEADLAARRPEMEPDLFRAEAEDFDRRVTEIRRTQDGKTRALVERRDALADGFWQEVLPVLGAIMTERGAGVILDRGDVFLTASEVDVTVELVARLDALAGPPAPGAGEAAAPADGREAAVPPDEREAAVPPEGAAPAD